MTDIPLFLWFEKVFRRFAQKVAFVDAQQNKQLPRCDQQLVDGLTRNETMAFETQKAKLVEPRYRTFHACKAPILWILLHETITLDVKFSTINTTELTNQSDIGSVLSRTSSASTIPLIANVSRLYLSYGQFCRPALLVWLSVCLLTRS